jgi:hypothetical protein
MNFIHSEIIYPDWHYLADFLRIVILKRLTGPVSASTLSATDTDAIVQRRCCRRRSELEVQVVSRRRQRSDVVEFVGRRRYENGIDRLGTVVLFDNAFVGVRVSSNVELFVAFV